MTAHFISDDRTLRKRETRLSSDVLALIIALAAIYATAWVVGTLRAPRSAPAPAAVETPAQPPLRAAPLPPRTAEESPAPRVRRAVAEPPAAPAGEAPEPVAQPDPFAGLDVVPPQELDAISQAR